MRGRFLSGAAVVAAVLTLSLVVPTSAQAAYKPPVDPYPDLPSWQYKTSWVQTSTGPSQVGYMPGSTAYAEEAAQLRSRLQAQGYAPPATTSSAKVNAVRTGRVPDISSLPKTLTLPTAVKAVVGGGLALGAFQLGWGITDGVLGMYTAHTGTNPLAGACDVDDWVQSATKFLYQFSAPSCDVPFVLPNEDALGTGWAPATWNGGTAQTTAVLPGPPSPRACLLSKPPVSWTDPVTGRPVAISYRLASGQWSSNNFKDLAPINSGDIQNCRTGKHITLVNSVNPTTFVFLYNFADGKGGTLSGVVEPVMTSNDPLREPECEIVWNDGVITSFKGEFYKESEPFPADPVESACRQTFNYRSAEDVQPSAIRVKTKNLETGQTTPILEQAVPVPNAEEKAALADKSGKGLVLWKGAASCLAWAADCAGWWEATGRGTSTATDYRCTYGDAVVSLAQCYVYERTFEPATDPQNQTPVITDPATAEPVPWTGNDSMNSTDPGTGPMPGDNCMDSWGAAPNPIEWVMHPVKCAMVWAFVARDAKVTEAQQKIDSSWRGSTPGQLSAALLTISPAVAALADGGCGGIVLAYPAPDDAGGFHLQNAAILPACPGDFFAPWAPVFKFFIGVGLAVGGVAAIKRLLDTFVGMS